MSCLKASRSYASRKEKMSPWTVNFLVTKHCFVIGPMPQRRTSSIAGFTPLNAWPSSTSVGSRAEDFPE
jgi:hypothetical protein